MESEITIDHGIPIPRRKLISELYPWHKLEVGDSFFVPLTGSDLRTLQNRLRARASQYAYFNKIILTTRTTYEGGVYGVRVWRTA